MVFIFVLAKCDTLLTRHGGSIIDRLHIKFEEAEVMDNGAMVQRQIMRTNQKKDTILVV